ncbi:MAG: hypothetical protein H7144_03515 [Burkholderiales bacterium]|nr:hypothetical protein [Phycisphaerae bacterium]
MTRVSSKHRRGAALVVAIAVLGLVAAGIVGLASVATGEFRRTRLEQQIAQTQQYQLAAIVIAHAQLQAGATADGPLTMPDASLSATCAWKTADAGSTICVITIDGAARELTFGRNGANWVLKRSRPAD